MDLAFLRAVIARTIARALNLERAAAQ